MGKVLRHLQTQDLLKNLDLSRRHQGKEMKRCTPIHCSKMLEEKPTRPMEMWIRCRGGLSRGQEAPEGGGGGSGDVGRRYGSGEVWRLTKRGDPPDPR